MDLGMDGWFDRWMDGLIPECMVGQIEILLDGWMDVWID